jgi:hypothetical protein
MTYSSDQAFAFISAAKSWFLHQLSITTAIINAGPGTVNIP